jgi:hypothetical protein
MMLFMDELRRLFHRKPRPHYSLRRPVEIDVTATQAEGLADEVRGSSLNGEVATELNGSPLLPVHRKPTISELQRGYEEVVSLVHKIGDHLDAQTQRTERLVELMERLPEAIDALPEVHRQNARLLDALSEHLARGRQRDETMSETLGKLSESSVHQTEVLGLLQQQFDSSTRAAEQMTVTLGGFTGALGELSENHQRSTEVLKGLMRTTGEREARIIEMMSRTQKWLIGLMMGVGAVAVAAVIFAALAMTR